MGSSLREAADFIDKAIRGGGVALVHCAAGASRSATAVLAYQVRVRGRARLRASIRG
jgi:protein-tyrosine phosphatase